MSVETVIPIVVRELTSGQLRLHIVDSLIAEHEGGGLIPRWNASPDYEVVLQLGASPISQWDDQKILRRLRAIELTDIESVLTEIDDLIRQASSLEKKAKENPDAPHKDGFGVTYREHSIVHDKVLLGLQLFLEESRDDENRPLWQAPDYKEAYRSLVGRIYGIRLSKGIPERQRRPTGQINQLVFKLDPHLSAVMDLPDIEPGVPPTVAQFQETIIREMRRDSEKWTPIINHIAEFTKSVTLDSQEALHLCNLVKALLALAEREEEFRQIIAQQDPRQLRQIHQFIVRMETDLGDLKRHLGYLLQLEASYRRREELFNDLYRYCNQNAQERLEQAIVEHHLAIYDLDAAGRFLQRAHSAQGLKKCLAFLYRQTAWCFVGFLGLIFLAFLLPMLLLRLGVHIPMIGGQQWIILGLGVWFILVLLAGIVLLLKMRRERLPYFQFFLPRLFGALAVGFIPLTFDALPWRTGINLDWIPYGILALLAYGASFFYLLFEVHRVRGPLQDMDFRQVWRSAWKLFLLAWMEALLIGTIISVLLLPIVLDELSQFTGGVLIQYSPWFSIGLYPKLVFFWAGVAMFIGAFVQLLWEGGKVSEPL